MLLARTLTFGPASGIQTPVMSVSVGRIFDSVRLSVCLFVCLFVCPQHNSETNDDKVFKLGVGNDLEVVQFWGSKVKVTDSISAFFTLMPGA